MSVKGVHESWTDREKKRKNGSIDEDQREEERWQARDQMFYRGCQNRENWRPFLEDVPGR